MTDILRDIESPNQQYAEIKDVLESIVDEIHTLKKKVESFSTLGDKVERLERKFEDLCSNRASKTSLACSSIEHKNNEFIRPLFQSSNGAFEGESKDDFALRMVNPVAESRGEHSFKRRNYSQF